MGSRLHAFQWAQDEHGTLSLSLPKGAQERKVSNITAELGRALAVVKVTLQVNGNTQFLGSAPKNYWGAKGKMWYKWLHLGGKPTCKIW